MFCNPMIVKQQAEGTQINSLLVGIGLIDLLIYTMHDKYIPGMYMHSTGKHMHGACMSAWHVWLMHVPVLLSAVMARECIPAGRNE